MTENSCWHTVWTFQVKKIWNKQLFYLKKTNVNFWRILKAARQLFFFRFFYRVWQNHIFCGKYGNYVLTVCVRVCICINLYTTDAILWMVFCLASSLLNLEFSLLIINSFNVSIWTLRWSVKWIGGICRKIKEATKKH